MANSIYDTVKSALRSELAMVVADLLPGGRVKGNEYICGSVSGGPGESCKTNLKTGVGQDFATDEKWGDPIALAAVVRNCSQRDAAQYLAEQYGVDLDNSTAPAKKRQTVRKATGKPVKDKTDFTPVMPIPDSAPDFPPQYRTGARWCYRDADGMELCYSFRLDRPDGSKDFVPLCFGTNAAGFRQWKEAAPPAPRPLYGLDKLAAAAPDAPILLVEGEKTADAAQSVFPGHVCMTWMGGGNATGKADFSPLAGRAVSIWPDNDVAGIKAAAELVGILHGYQTEAKTVYPPDFLPEKWDLADPAPDGFAPCDYLAATLERDDFLRAIRYKHGETELGEAALDLLAKVEDDFDVPTWPVLSPDALPGFVGQFVELATRHSEADPAAVLATLLVRFGAEVYGYQKDKGPFLAIGEAIHPPRLFAVVCGNSSKARKGTSRQPVTRLFKRDLCDPEELDRLHLPPPARESGGPLSTGEGLAYPLRENAQNSNRDPNDKRLCIMDEELASGLSCTKREGNTLSMAIRTFWDGGEYSPLTKTNPMEVKGAHICLLSHITKEELEMSLSSVNMANGFGNRFLWICARRSKNVALPRPMPVEEIAVMQRRLWELVALAQQAGEVYLTGEAMQEWSGIYQELSADTYDLTGAIVNRAEAQTMRLALVYALLDGKKAIDTPHITSALALWRYANASAACLFCDRAMDPTEQKIVSILRAGPCTTSGLHRALSGHVTGAKLQRILSSMEASNRIVISLEKTAGRSCKRITLRERRNISDMAN